MSSAAERELIYDREAALAAANGRGIHPLCNLCDAPVVPGQDWDISHVGAPKALGGSQTGIAHRRCNRADNATYVTPAIAKAKRQARKHKGAIRPGTSKRRLPGGRSSAIKIKLDRSVVARKSQGELLAQTLRKREVGP